MDAMESRESSSRAAARHSDPSGKVNGSAAAALSGISSRVPIPGTGESSMLSDLVQQAVNVPMPVSLVATLDWSNHGYERHLYTNGLNSVTEAELRSSVRRIIACAMVPL